MMRTTGGKMASDVNNIYIRLTASIIYAIALPCGASTVSFTGTLFDPNQVILQTFLVGGQSTLTIQTLGYGGGVNGVGQSIVSGGFDPIVTVFDPSGVFVNDNDDGQCPPGNVSEGNCFDSTLSLFITSSGNYTVALTASPNFSAGTTLADGFLGIGDFNGRSSSYAFDVAIDTASSVPEPATLGLLICGIFLLIMRRLKCLVQFRKSINDTSV